MSLIRDRTWATSALAASTDFRVVLSRAFSPFSVAPEVFTSGLLEVELVAGSGVAGKEGACAVELDLVQLQLAVGLGDRGIDLEWPSPPARRRSPRLAPAPPRG